MILFCLLLSLEIETQIDSLETLLDQHPDVLTVIELNKLYLKKNEFDKGINLLKKHETHFTSVVKPIILYALGEDYFFAGKIIVAREEYLKLVGRFPRSDIANDALERIYLIENARKDTVLLKRLAYSVCLYETEQFNRAEDSLKILLKTKIGDYAYYYLALLYHAQDELSLVLGVLNELNNSFPEHKIHNVFLFLADVHLELGNKKDAQNILEELIIKDPTSIYALRARKLLKEVF